MKKFLLAIWEFLLDLTAASYFVMTRRQVVNDIESHDPVVVKTRGGKLYYQRLSGPTAGLFDVTTDDLASTDVWWYQNFRIAQSIAAGFNRSLGARRRMVLVVLGIAFALLSRWLFGCLI